MTIKATYEQHRDFIHRTLQKAPNCRCRVPLRQPLAMCDWKSDEPVAPVAIEYIEFYKEYGYVMGTPVVAIIGRQGDAKVTVEVEHL